MRYGYARVSTDEQNLARQRTGLSRAGCDRVVEEVESGVKARRRLDGLLQRLHDGDELIVSELDRLGRSTGEAVLLMDELIRRGVHLRVLALPSLDIATNDGRLIADILASLAAQASRAPASRDRRGAIVRPAFGPPAKDERSAGGRGARQAGGRRAGARGRARLWRHAEDAACDAGAFGCAGRGLPSGETRPRRRCGASGRRTSESPAPCRARPTMNRDSRDRPGAG